MPPAGDAASAPPLGCHGRARPAGVKGATASLRDGASATLDPDRPHSCFVAYQGQALRLDGPHSVRRSSGDEQSRREPTRAFAQVKSRDGGVARADLHAGTLPGVQADSSVPPA